MVDYKIRTENDIDNTIFQGDIFFDSTGDIVKEGELDTTKDVQVVSEDILYAIIGNKTEIYAYIQDDIVLAQRFIEDLFINDNRLESFIVTINEDNSIDIKFTLPNGNTGGVTV